jgi:hypothetical protein
MADEGKEFQGIDWRRTFASLEILRSFRMAIHPASLLLCFVGLGATLGLGVLIDQIPGVGGTEVHGKRFFENVKDIATFTLWGNWAMPYVGGRTWEDFSGFVMGPVAAARDGVLLLCGYWDKGWPARGFVLIYGVLLLALWALIGGAVTRMAAVRVAREESVPLKKAVCFSTRKWLSTVTSPLIPFGVLVLLGILIGAPTGLFLLIPYVGEWVVGVLFGLTLLAGFVLALIFVGGTFSLGLQWPTIAAEGSDSFDAISRSISYISSRPWKYLFYTIFATLYGCLTFIFVKFVTFLTLRITHDAVSTFCFCGSGVIDDKLERLWQLPAHLSSVTPEPGIEFYYSEAWATYLFLFWVWVVLLVAMAFLVSFFFTSQTVIYFLLRKTVDATDIEEVYMEESEEEELPIEHPVEGSAAAGGEPARPKPPEKPGGGPAEEPPPTETAT